MRNKTMNEKYTLFINTLNLILLPVKEMDVPYLVSIQSQLEELEGDYYTFFHQDFIFELVKNGYLSEQAVDRVQAIRLKISKIEIAHWNGESFINNEEWKSIRCLVVDLLMDNVR